jgi:ubiquinone/menaquinone biosynthesis C-methylase UbiE
MVGTDSEVGRPTISRDQGVPAEDLARSRGSLIEADSVLGRLWDQDVLAWDKYWVPVFRLFAKDLVKDASPKLGDVVLDLGTGTGVAALEVSGAVRSLGLVVGIDRSESMIAFAQKKAAKAGSRNLRFLKMTDEGLRFPDEFFDIVISNCGIGIPTFAEDLKEILRVLRPGGVLVFNDWHLIDVEPHRVFGEVLGKYRTRNPSMELAQERSALAAMESFHHSLNSETQVQMVRSVGFGEVQLKTREYTVRMRGPQNYLDMRLCRATIRREMSEMLPRQRELFLEELRERLRKFSSRRDFVFRWGVFFIRGHKAVEESHVSP